MKVPVFYRPEMAVNGERVSPSAAKPREVVASWCAKFSSLEVLEPEPATVEELCLAHDRDYVEGILSGRLPNGFGTREPELARSLPYTSGAMVAAARAALANRKVAVAPCSGFHHARWSKAAGYCTFNGLMVAALVLRNEGVAPRVGILDFDLHYGDGTEEIIDHLGFDGVTHYSAGEFYVYRTQAEEFLSRIPDVAGEMAKCDIVLYQAGADPHVNDPMGGWLTTEQLRTRDRLVFETLAGLGVPVAWNLAGGYQRPLHHVLAIHDNTMEECIAVYVADGQ